MISLLFFFCFYRRAIGENPVANSVNRRNGADAVRSSGSIRGTTALFVVFLCFSRFFSKFFFSFKFCVCRFFFHLLLWRHADFRPSGAQGGPK